MEYIARVVRTLSRYSPGMRLALVLVLICLFSLSFVDTTTVVAADPCVNSWNISLAGLKPTYNRSEVISVTATFSIRNHSLSPGTYQQILVGIVDGNRQSYGVACIYGGQALVCPQETKDTANFTLTCPPNPGTYQILASNYQLYSCEDAKRIFPKNPASDRIIATIQVSDSGISAAPGNPGSLGGSPTGIPSTNSGTNTPAVNQPTTPSAVPTSQMPSITTWFQQNQQTIFTILALIIIFIAGLLYLVRKQRNMMDRVVLISIGGIASLFLLWIYVFVPIINFIIQHWLAILISVVVLIAILVLAGIRGWIRIGRPTTTTTMPLPQPLANEGWVYVMRYAYHAPDLYKIGKTGTHPDQRLIELSRETGSPTPPVLVNDWKVRDHHTAESTIHQALDQYRVNPKREFFQVPYKVIQATIDKIVADMEKDDTLS